MPPQTHSDSPAPEPEGSADQHLREERYRLALRASSEGVWDWDIDSNEIYYSDQALKLLGYERASAPNIVGNARDHLHPQDAETITARLAAYLATGDGSEPFAVECRFRTASGEFLWFRLRAVGVWDYGYRPVRLVGTLANITPRKIAEEALLEERHLLRQLIDTIPVNIYFKDLASRFTLANRAIARWFGRDNPEELVGMSDADFFAAEHAEKALRDEQEIIRTGKPLVGDVEKETWSHREDTWVVTTKAPLRDRYGNIRGTFGVSSDVTELVRTQRALRDTAAELESKNRGMEEELHLAREVQQALLPRSYPCFPAHASPENSLLRFAHRYLPIGGLAGDFFQVFPVSETAAGVLVCDVMGHGVRSALVTAVLRGMIEEERRAAHDPGTFLGRLNAALTQIIAQVDVTTFVTAHYMVIDPTGRTIAWASAAHPRPVWLSRASGRVGRLPDPPPKRGPVLGLLPEATYSTASRDLGDIDAVVLFTDGIYETDNRSCDNCPEDLFLSFFGSRIREPIGAILDGVLGDALTFAEGNHFIDDVCIVATEIAGPRPTP